MHSATQQWLRQEWRRRAGRERAGSLSQQAAAACWPPAADGRACAWRARRGAGAGAWARGRGCSQKGRDERRPCLWGARAGASMGACCVSGALAAGSRRGACRRPCALQRPRARAHLGPDAMAAPTSVTRENAIMNHCEAGGGGVGPRGCGTAARRARLQGCERGREGARARAAPTPMHPPLTWKRKMRAHGSVGLKPAGGGDARGSRAAQERVRSSGPAVASSQARTRAVLASAAARTPHARELHRVGRLGPIGRARRLRLPRRAVVAVPLRAGARASCHAGWRRQHPARSRALAARAAPRALANQPG